MNTGRMPACSALFTLSQGENTTGARQDIESDNTLLSALTQPQKLDKHDKNHIKMPSFYGKGQSLAGNPYYLQKFGSNLQYLADHIRRGISRDDIEREQDKPTGTLSWYVSLPENKKYLGLLYHHRDGKPRRKRRIDGFSTVVFSVMAALVHGANIHKMAYGCYKEGNQFRFFDYRYLAKKARVSKSQLKRAMRELKKDDLVSVKNIVEEDENGSLFHYETQIYISADIFEMMGIKEQFLKDRAYAIVAFQKRQLQIDARKAFLEAHLPEPMKEKKKKLNPNFKPAYIPKYNPVQDKNILNIAAKIMAENPGMTPSDAIMMAAERNKSPPN